MYDREKDGKKKHSGRLKKVMITEASNKKKKKKNKVLESSEIEIYLSPVTGVRRAVASHVEI